MTNTDKLAFDQNLAEDFERVFQEHQQALQLVVPPGVPPEMVRSLMAHNPHLGIFMLPCDRDWEQWYVQYGNYFYAKRRARRAELRGDTQEA